MSEHEVNRHGPKLNRRSLLVAAPGVALSGLGMSAIGSASAQAQSSVPGASAVDVDDYRLTTPESAIVATRAGRVRGYLDGDIFTFKGVPYAADTGGRARFLPPAAPQPWSGVKSTMVFGPICPQVDYTGVADDGPTFLRMTQFDYPSEDCLKLNVWTPGVNDGRARPVLVWFHGGAFLNGSANRVMSHGKNLARRGDVVVVSVHHRLNVLGYLDLSPMGEQYRDSANAGALDMVAALQWVHDNIASFGGDPGCVTIFGQSGGGAKVATLMAMPRARGLFHRAVVQSSSSRISNSDQAERLSASFLERAGITRTNLDSLLEMPVDTLVRIGTEVAAAPLDPGDDWRPKVDGREVLQQPFEPSAPQLSADIPVLLGGTRHEFAPAVGVGRIPEAELMTRLVQRFGDTNARQLHGYFTSTYPGISTNEILALVNVQPFRANHLKNAGRLAARAQAPAYYYIFSWQTPMLDGLPLAYHGVEVPFVFSNIRECAPITGNLPEAHALSDQMCDAWLAFARTGNPNHAGLPEWDAFTSARGNAMIFDTVSQQVDHPWRGETEAVTAAGGTSDRPDTTQLMRS